MTPKQADLVNALERTPGVRAVYAVSGDDIELAVHLAEAQPRALAQAHDALSHWIAPYQWRRVLFFEVALPPFLEARATRLELTAEEREQARQRQPPPPSRLVDEEPLAKPPPGPFSCLVVSDDPEVESAAKEAFGPRAKVMVERDKHTAFWRARDESFDLILCETALAFGKSGLLSELAGLARDVARRVVVLAGPGEVELVSRDLEELRALNSVVSHPIAAKHLRELVASGAIVQRWPVSALPDNAPILPVIPSAPPPPSKPGRRVLVVDDDPETALLLSRSPEEFAVTVTDDEWEAADAMEGDDLALVVCSVTLRTRGGTPFYRFLWTARPDIKSRFVFLVRPDTPPMSAGRVVTRPLTRDALTSLVAARA